LIDVNTTSRYPTHFLRAVELIKRARGQFGIPSENWPHPTGNKFGCPRERYYAEIWVDGMDWQPSYWVIEEKDLKSPLVSPFIIFKTNEIRDKFNEYDFSQLVYAALWYRRDEFWVKNDDLGVYTDLIWPFLKVVNSNETAKMSNLTKVYFEHASQNKVTFLMNLDFIPEKYRKISLKRLGISNLNYQ